MFLFSKQSGPVGIYLMLCLLIGALRVTSELKVIQAYIHFVGKNMTYYRVIILLAECEIYNSNERNMT